MSGENVKELLEEVKNISGLMMDLAYSSILFENKDIAKEVMILFEELEKKEEKLYMHLFAASRGMSARKLISVTDLVEAAKLVAMGARNLSEMVLAGSALHPVIKDALKDSDDSIVKAEIKKKSMLCSKTIGDNKIRTETGIDIVAIKRSGRWIFDPQKRTKLLNRDIIIGVGSNDSCKKIQRVARGVEKI